jgi:hypothetical protein
VTISEGTTPSPFPSVNLFLPLSLSIHHSVDSDMVSAKFNKKNKTLVLKLKRL